MAPEEPDATDPPDPSGPSVGPDLPDPSDVPGRDLTTPDPATPDPPEPPVRELVHSARAHPSWLPELLAQFAVRHRGPRAARRVAGLREAHPDAPQAELVRRIVDHARRVSQSEGAFVGGPFLWMAPFAFCIALLAQGQLMLELAAVSGKDPAARERVAELLVIQGAHPDRSSAERALAAGPPAPKGGGRLRGFLALVWRMARLLGLTTVDEDPPPSRRRTVGEWVLVLVVLLVGLVAPLVWLPYMALSYHWATDRLAARAAAYYFGGDPAEWLGVRHRRADPGAIAAALRAGLSLLLPLVGVIVVVGADLRVAGSHWPVLAGVVISLSCLVGVLWYRGHRTWRNR
ncbi:hypothetical protein OH807_04830 [Kitasatospora sp. NBC_01560]|uniref:hypothetical protein n=1 Tax=Kitasatospora sp. NBC_01560 TaxID=2975965 RepID=UPI00386C0FE6